MKQDKDLLSIISATGLFTDFSEESLREFSSNLTWVYLKEGETLLSRGDRGSIMYIVIEGHLHASITKENNKKKILEEIDPNMTIGMMQLLEGGNYTADIIADQESKLLQLTKTRFVELVNKFPGMIEKMAEIVRLRLRRNRVMSVLSRIFEEVDNDTLHEIESKTEWIHLNRGEPLFLQGQPHNGLFFVISGRLQSFIDDENGSWPFGGEIESGEIIGELEICLEEERETSVYAIRESHLVKFSKVEFTEIIDKYPRAMRKITQILIRRLKNTVHRVRRSGFSPLEKNLTMSFVLISDNPEVPLSEFADKLATVLARFGPTLYLNSERVDHLIGKPGIAQSTDSLRLNSWLAEQEAVYRFMIYEADISYSPWTRKAIYEADQVLIVAWADGSPEIGPVESQLLRSESQTKNDVAKIKQTLVLLHPEGTKYPSGTNLWLSKRNVEKHLHVKWEQEEDFQRLARFLAGRAIGVVLSGGGARGFAHVGVLTAILEAGIPIDMIGGTSIGAVIAFSFALGWSFERFLDFVRVNFVESNPFKEYTLPVISILKGRKLEQGLSKGFRETLIEDFWLNAFCVSSNLSTTEINIHRRGLAWKAVRASISLPGILAPVVDSNSLLVDGGVLDNLPGEIMRKDCNGFLIATDVTEDSEFRVKGNEFPSPWRVLFSRFLPFVRAEAAPHAIDILVQSIVLSSINKTRKVKVDADLYLNPPVDHFKSMDLSAFSQIAEVGYNYSKEKVLEWKEILIKEGVL
ncbi:MAG: cyclic nucleotide-binding domain-containing protein [bacterium]|nr:cyclic nucleotide-binding domain-containing protein [bacterium]